MRKIVNELAQETLNQRIINSKQEIVGLLDMLRKIKFLSLEQMSESLFLLINTVNQFIQDPETKVIKILNGNS